MRTLTTLPDTIGPLVRRSLHGLSSVAPKTRTELASFLLAFGVGPCFHHLTAMLTNKAAAKLVADALNRGCTLTIQCPNGDTLTVGRKSAAVGPQWYHALRWGRSRFAAPSGREVSCDPIASFVAADIAQHCGRGNAAKAARTALASE